MSYVSSLFPLNYYAQDISRAFFVKFNSFKNYIAVNLDTYIVV